MRIDLRNPQRQRLFEVHLEPSDPPSVVQDPRGRHREVYLNWDRALDDESRLRRCPACGCEDLYQRNDFPRLTIFIIILLAVILAMVMIGNQNITGGLMVLGAVALFDIILYLLSGLSLVCYRCGSEFRGTPIPKRFGKWDSTLADRYPASSGDSSENLAAAAASSDSDADVP